MVDEETPLAGTGTSSATVTIGQKNSILRIFAILGGLMYFGEGFAAINNHIVRGQPRRCIVDFYCLLCGVIILGMEIKIARFASFKSFLSTQVAFLTSTTGLVVLYVAAGFFEITRVSVFFARSTNCEL